MTIFTPRPQWIVDLINELAGTGGGTWGAISGTLSNQTDLQTALNGKASTSHTHVISDVTGLQTALDNKVDDSQLSAFGASLIDDADAAAARTTLGLGTAATSATGDFAAASHSHAISDITNLQTSLDNKLDDSQLDTDTSLAANSDTKIATQKAVKTYIDTANGFRGCLVNKSADETAANYSAGAIIPFGAEVYDTDGFHDNVTNNSRITIPSAVNGRYGIFRASVYIDATLTADRYFQMYMKKNGAFAVPGLTGQFSETGSATMYNSFSTAPILLTAGDYYQVEMLVELDTSINLNKDLTWFSLQVL